MRSLPNLTYLHLFCTWVRLPVSAADMAHDMKHLRMVGIKYSLWDIVRVGNDETLLQWSHWKGRRRIEEDFRGDDGWLLSA
jgi:hypothetical protein